MCLNSLQEMRAQVYGLINMALFAVTNNSGRPKSFNSWITDIQSSHDGNIYVFGNFTEYDGISAGAIIKIDPTDGDISPDFDYGTGFGGNYAFSFTGLVRENTTNQLFVGGLFTSYDGTPANRIVKLDTDGSIVSAFDYGTGFNNWTLKPGYDGTFVYYPGIAGTYKGVTTNRIAKINATTGILDAAFNAAQTGTDNTVIQIIPDGLGNLYVHGYFNSYNGSSADRLIRINDTTGVVDPGFDIGVSPNNSGNNMPMTLAIKDTADRIYMGGYFTTWNSISHNRMVRLNLNGTVDNTFDIGTGFNGVVNFISEDPVTQNIYVSGGFTDFNGTTVYGAVIIDNTGTLVHTVDVPVGFGFESVTRIGSVWYCSANNYTTGRYYLVKVDDNGNREFI